VKCCASWARVEKHVIAISLHLLEEKDEQFKKISN